MSFRDRLLVALGTVMLIATVATRDNASGSPELAPPASPAASSAPSAPFAWGANWTGQIGDGTHEDRWTPVRIEGLSRVTQVAAGPVHSLALLRNGTVWSWGYAPTRVKGLSRVAQVAVGGDHNLAVRRDGTVWAWGLNDDGQLGNGIRRSRSIPVRVRGLRDVTAVSAGWHHSLALRSDGTVWTWGRNASGQLGDGTSGGRRHKPRQVLGLSRVTQIAAGSAHNLALRRNGSAFAWGNNSAGQLGDGTSRKRSRPVRVHGLSDVTQVAAGVWHSLAVRTDGTAWGWGSNFSGELGDGTARNDRSAPVQVEGLSGVTQVAGGWGHSLAVRADGTAWGWGYNGSGQLGAGASSPIWPSPIQVRRLSSVSAVAAGGGFSLAVDLDLPSCARGGWRSEGGATLANGDRDEDGPASSLVQRTEERLPDPAGSIVHEVNCTAVATAEDQP